ncbi:MAG: DUF4175 domain-containing protein [Bryobacteraceae bacterium]|nr:DUF4175 domain-containing protein [Bryobacteraceae bacterium]MDW8376906.1 hypothetical protein [Bryobacterales bacterium]
MSAFDQLELYLRRIENRLRILALTRGLAIAAAAALVATVLLVMLANGFAFSEGSLQVSRFLLFLAIAFAVSFGIVTPLLRLNARRAARRAEGKYPEFGERLLTFAERGPGAKGDPFVELLAADTVEVARKTRLESFAPGFQLLGFALAALLVAISLIWLTTSGPGYLGHGAALLWGGTPRDVQPYYSIQVTPGNRRLRRRTDQLVTAHLLGFQSSSVRVFARYKGTSKWEQAPMTPQSEGNGFEFLFAGLPETVDYYVEAGSIRSPKYTLEVVDLPGIQKIRVRYRYPAWSGLQNASEEGSGDLRAVKGTEAEVAFLMDKPLAGGLLLIDNQTEVPLREIGGGWIAAKLRIEKDGVYHVAAIDQGQRVRLSEDFFIEARQALEPVVKILRPRGDARVSPIEEVTLEVEAEDDYGLQEVKLHYSVNGGEEKVVNLLPARGLKQVSGRTLLALEEYRLVPGDVVSAYATARDAQTETRTDMIFIQAEPFEREFSQSQQMGGGGGSEGGPQENEISSRQKEVIAATWNQIRDRSNNREAAAENGKFLADVQSKLKDQAASLARRMRSRELAGTNDQFKNFATEMERAAEEMAVAAEKLKALAWKEALGPEQRALQHLLRAESTFREIQVAFGQAGGGGGMSGGGRDLASLFDLELDTEKNQYETGRQSSGGEDDKQKKIDEALQKLEQLARRQKELAEQQRKQPNAPQQRWQQEMLRREAEELQRQMQQLAGQTGQSGQSGRQGQSSQQASASQSGSGLSSGQQSSVEQRLRQLTRRQDSPTGSSGQSGADRIDPRVARALDELKRATEDMRRTGQGSSDEANARRAAERLQQAQDLLSSLRRQENSGQVGDLARRAEDMANRQRAVQQEMFRMFGQGQNQDLEQMQRNIQRSRQLAAEQEKLARELKQLEQDMQRAVRELSESNKAVSSKIREALGEMQGSELARNMEWSAQYLRQGYGPQIYNREMPLTNGLDRLRLGLAEAREMLDREGGKQGSSSELERALNQIERLRAQLQRLTEQQRNPQGAQSGQQEQAGQQGQRGQQNQAGQQGQGGQQGASGQQRQTGQPGQAGQTGQVGQTGQPGQRSQSAQVGQPGNRQGLGGRGGAFGGERPLPGEIQGGRAFDDRRDIGYGALNDGTLRAPRGPLPAEFQRALEGAYREGLRDLQEIRQSLRETDMETAAQVAELIREMQRLDPSRFPGNPALLEQLRAQLLPDLEQMEIQIRRQLEEKQGGQVRTSTSDRIPTGYAEAIAEYFRKLSKGK